MPNIPQYDAPISGLKPDEAGAATLARVARYKGFQGEQLGKTFQTVIDQGGRLGAEIGADAERHAAMTEISQGAASFARVQNQLVSGWNDTAATSDLNDNTIADKFREKQLEPAIQAWQGGFQTKQGQEWALNHADSFRQHMFEKTSGDMMTRAGDAAVVNLNTTTTNLSNAARNDTHFFEQALAAHQDAVDAIVANSGVSADVASKLRTTALQRGQSEIAKATVAGMIDRNPVAAAKELEGTTRFDDYITGTEKQTMLRAATTAQRMDQEAARSAQAEQKRQNTDAANTVANAVTASMISDDGSSVTVPHDYYDNLKKLAQMPDTPPGLVRSMVDMGRAVTREVEKGKPAVTDPHTYSGFADRMVLPNTDPNALTMRDVFDARAAGKLSDKDMTFFKSAVTDLNKDPQKTEAYKQYTSLVNSFKTSITRSSATGAFPQEDQRFGQFQHDTRDRFEASYANGNWRDLLNPSSPQYLGKMLSAYTYDTKQGTKMVIGNATQGVGLAEPADVPRRNDGESAADFLRRVSGGK